jgi:hypothetical protein
MDGIDMDGIDMDGIEMDIWAWSHGGQSAARALSRKARLCMERSLEAGAA